MALKFLRLEPFPKMQNWSKELVTDGKISHITLRTSNLFDHIQ